MDGHCRDRVSRLFTELTRGSRLSKEARRKANLPLLRLLIDETFIYGRVIIRVSEAPLNFDVQVRDRSEARISLPISF